MGFETFVIESAHKLEKMEQNREISRARQATSFEKAFQSSRYQEGTKPRHIPTINEGRVGERIGNVTYARRVFTLDGEKVEGVFPIFESKFNTLLPKRLYMASDNEQMKYCTKMLAARIEKDPEMAARFTPRQLEQIRNGEPRISGLTWHHNERPGFMQLVDSNDHSMARHTGGRSIWGGGNEIR